MLSYVFFPYSNIYKVLFVGVRLVIQDGMLTYYGPNGFKYVLIVTFQAGLFPKLFCYIFSSSNSWCGVIIYWLLVFSICVAFLAILTAQFTRSFENLAQQAHMKCIRRKMVIMQKIDDTLCLFICLKQFVSL